MPFAPVKSNPYMKGVRIPRGWRHLWPETVWKRLCEIALLEGCIGPLTLAEIRDANKRATTYSGRNQL